MRLGLADTVLFERYGAWWSNFLSAIGVEVVLPRADFAESLRVGQSAMHGELPTIQLLVGRVLELSTSVDGLLIPDLHPGAESGTRGAALEPWLVDLPMLLGQRFSLPTVYKVPPRLEPAETTRLAVQLGQMFTGNAQLVRRNLDRLQLKPLEPAEPLFVKAGSTTVGLVGDPVLLEQEYLMQEPRRVLEQAGLHLVPISAMPKARAIEEGQRINKNLLELDLEMIGAARLLAQKAAVRGLVYLHQPFGVGQQQLMERSIKNTQKPCVLLEWGNLDLEKLNAFVEAVQ